MQTESGIFAALASLSAGMDLLVMLGTDPRKVVLFSLLLCAGVIDYHTQKIPNWLTLSGTSFALIYAAFVPFTPIHGFLWACGGLAVGFILLVPLYVLRVMGAGDVKLMAMIGAFLGVSDTFNAVIASFIVGGVAALFFAVYHRVFGRMISNVKAVTELMLISAATGVKAGSPTQAVQSVGKLPYGVSIGIGTIGYVIATQLGIV
ncbi:prepilin peptidase [Herbaspirillum sp. GCM10030257]|uniref:A24 family peptidase n=1 Tax=Herbaspirillum sp. GCM10030257 TaxID=3273393 RepID=UPI0036116483